MHLKNLSFGSRTILELLLFSCTWSIMSIYEIFKTKDRKVNLNIMHNFWKIPRKFVKMTMFDVKQKTEFINTFRGRSNLLWQISRPSLRMSPRS